MQTDRVLRAMTDDGAFRVLTIRSTDTARGVVEAQGVAGEAARHLGELVTATVLVRETMSPVNRAQIVIKDAKGAQLVGDSWPDGMTRGLAQLEDDVLGPDFGGNGGMLQVTRLMHGGKPYQGTALIEHEGGVAKAIMTYFQQSEQIVSMVALGCAQSEGDIVAAGGFVVQLLPEVTDPPLAVMTERLRQDFTDITKMLTDSDADPQVLLKELLYGLEFTELADSSFSFGCHCSEDRVLGAVAVLGEEDLRDMVEKQETAKVSCDYCRQRYEIAPPVIAQILQDKYGGTNGQR